VACREHRTRDPQQTRWVVQLVGGGEPDPHDIDPTSCQAAREGVHKLRARLPHVTTDDHPRSHCTVAVLRDHDDVPEGASNRSCDGWVELVGHDAAHVVGLDQ